ncbi:HD-GYP domain-containing protein [Cognatilysobacter lacus]|uniref:HD domain-containing protein n=1 Tax=Cognatilysobacter lacus TaxID=1643323 RepID=A0A5D8Z4C1_9GAMM|nr:HD-GYP domain-containing protein [Lysobacter lacus]TZF89517.1 HD domain-containing protein [Lysobacter lacus]
MPALKLAELIGSLSYALDLTEGQPDGHCLRVCWIGMHVGDAIGLDADARWSLYYTLLLKDLGCSSNAARICEMYLADDRAFKRDFKQVGTGPLDLLGFVASHTATQAGWRRRLASLVNIARNGDALAQELIQTRCSRGAAIARRLRFPEAVASGIHSLDEHFDGSGRPDGLAGDAIPLASRIALLGQVVDVFQFAQGPDAALAEVRRRAGTWFDPQLVAALESVAQRPGFWQTLQGDGLEAAVNALEPPGRSMPLDDDYLDDIAEAFGDVVDAKSPFTAGHSARVGFYTTELARGLGIEGARLRWLRRAALLHDVGKLGVSNTILDKPGKLDAEEWRAVQRHAAYTGHILGRISAFDELARIAAAHHEKLDGTGYPLGLAAADITLETRIITTADIFDAITASRPYRGATPVNDALDIMRGHVGTAIDPVCFHALEALVAGVPA